MTTTIQPQAGNGVLFTQQGVGTTPGYNAIDERRAIASGNGGKQEGVEGTPTAITAGGVAGVAYADFMVTQRGAGANMSVDINMPAGGGAWVQGDTIDGQGLYYIPVHGSTINETIATADSSNPRVDIAILEVLDNVHDASGGNEARVRILTGSPQSGATLDSPTGRPVVPGSALLLADILVPASDTTISNSQIRDRRKWARGAYSRTVITAASYTGLNSTGLAFIDSTNLQPRIECSGVPLKIRLGGAFSFTSAAGRADFAPAVDASQPTDAGIRSTVPTGIDFEEVDYEWGIAPAAGSHKIGPLYAVSANSITAYATGTRPLLFEVQETVRQNAVNNAITTG